MKEVEIGWEMRLVRFADGTRALHYVRTQDDAPAVLLRPAVHLTLNTEGKPEELLLTLEEARAAVLDRPQVDAADLLDAGPPPP